MPSCSLSGGVFGYAPGLPGATGVNCTATFLVTAITPACQGMLSVHGQLTKASGAGGDSLRGFGPFLLAAMEERLAVFRQDPALFDQFFYRVCVVRDIEVASGIPFRDRRAWVACLLTLRRRLWEWKVRGFEGDTLIGRANGRIAPIPARIRRQGIGDFRQVHTVAFVAIGVDLGNKHREGLINFRGLESQNSFAPVRTKIETPGF